MRYLARRSVEHKVAVNGEVVWAIIFCENLSAHLDEEVKKIFGEEKFLQPIDAGLGRSVRLSVGRHLDEWIMNNDNMSRWEDKMTAPERRILTTNLVGKAIYEVMDTSKEGVSVACFERTSFLITVIADDTCKSNIRPHGMEKGKFHIPIEPVISLNLVEEKK